MKSPKATFKIDIKVSTLPNSVYAHAWCCDRLVRSFNFFPLPQNFEYLIECISYRGETARLLELSNKLCFIGIFKKGRYV